MRLEVDLRRNAPPILPEEEATRLDPDVVAGALRSWPRLSSVLRAHHYEQLTVLTGSSKQISGRQALVLAALASTRATRVVLDGRRMGRARFAARAAILAARTLSREAAASTAMASRISVQGLRRYKLPATSIRTQSALYLRVEPSLRWQGAQVGGAATHTSGVINGLIDGGVAVQVVAAERLPGIERANFLAVSPRRILDLVAGVGHADYARAVVAATAGAEADFVYERYQLGSVAGLEIAERLGVPLVLEFNGPEIWVARHWRGGRMLLGGPLQRLEHRNLRDASLVVVVSRALRDLVVAAGVPATRVLVNHNGVDADRLAPYRQGDPAQWRSRAGLPERPTVGFVGTFGRWHGVGLLPALAAAVPDAQWVLIGGGGLLPAVAEEVRRRGLEDSVILTGVVEHRRALEMLAASDVCISPHIPNPDGTPFFGSPTKLFEYMGLGRAIVASDLDQIGEVIEDGRSGLLCPPGEVEATAEAVRRLLREPELRARLGSAALERAINVYSWRGHARRTLEALTNRADLRTFHSADQR